MVGGNPGAAGAGRADGRPPRAAHPTLPTRLSPRTRRAGLARRSKGLLVIAVAAAPGGLPGPSGAARQGAAAHAATADRSTSTTPPTRLRASRRTRWSGASTTKRPGGWR